MPSEPNYIFLSSCPKNRVSFTASAPAIYSASAEEVATVFNSLDRQLIGPFHKQ